MEKEKSALEQLAQYPIRFSIPVQWGDQDSFGHVNNLLYLRWCESARIQYLVEIGLWQMYVQERVGPILASIQCNYRQPVVFPDQVHTGAKVTRVGNSSFQMDHLIVSEAQGVVADASSTLVVYDYKRASSCPIPDDVREQIRKIEARMRGGAV